MSDDFDLEKIVVTLRVMTECAPELVHIGIVRQYLEQLDRLGNLGHNIRDWQIPLDELEPLVYEVDDYGNALSESGLPFIDREAFLLRLEPALQCAELSLEASSGAEQDRVVRPEVEQAELDAKRRLSPSRFRDNIIDIMDRLLRDLQIVDVRLDAIRFPDRPRQQLRAWIHHIEEGRLSAADWTKLRNDLQDIFEHISDNLNDHDDLYELPSIQQHLSVAGDYVSSTMHDIEVLQGIELQAGLDAYNIRRRRAAAEGSHQMVSSQPVEVSAARKPAVFIGHGHSELWRALKDHIEDRLDLTAIYFEGSSRVGEHMKEILEGFADDSDCAIIILTQDDEQADGEERARQNVVHEVGFFQGKHGFKRVAMLIQNGVEEFSNVGGIIPIHFEGHRIRGAFPDVDDWLRREGFIP